MCVGVVNGWPGVVIGALICVVCNIWSGNCIVFEFDLTPFCVCVGVVSALPTTLITNGAIIDLTVIVRQVVKRSSCWRSKVNISDLNPCLCVRLGQP